MPERAWPASLGVGSHTERETSTCAICRESIVMERTIDVFDADLPFFMIGMFDIADDHGLCGIQMLGTLAGPTARPVGIRVRRDQAFLIGATGNELPFDEVPDWLWDRITLTDWIWKDSGD